MVMTFCVNFVTHQRPHFTTFPKPLLGLIGKLGRMRGITGAGALGKIFTAAQNNFDGDLIFFVIYHSSVAQVWASKG